MSVCVFYTIHFKEAPVSPESIGWKAAAEILLLGDFLQRKEGVLREIGSNSILCKVHIVQKILDKKPHTQTQTRAWQPPHKALKGGRLVPPLFETV